MRGVIRVAAVGLVLGLGVLVEPAGATTCPNDSVQSGTVCMDKYEASVWHVPPGLVNLIARIRNGTVTLANLTSARAVDAGVVQLGLAPGDLAAGRAPGVFAAGCPDTGNGCVDVYAVSIPGVTPALFITWFQAAAAARNSLKRLPTNQEWQVAALGTPDGAPCNVSSAGVANTGSNAGCFSDVGAFDMVGNLYEWVADWVPRSDTCPGWATFSEDVMCLGGASAFSGPGALLRGGDWRIDTEAGVFAVNALNVPYHSISGVGFRCAR